MQANKFWAAVSKALAITTVTLIVALILAPDAWAQSKYKSLYRFTGGADGSTSYAGLVFDAAGNLYGTTYSGGDYGSGAVFELSLNADGGWAEKVLYSFGGHRADGANPYAGVIFDPNGNLYGTTVNGGCTRCGAWGTLFELSPELTGTWNENVLRKFDMWVYEPFPYSGLIFDAAGNLYLTTEGGWNGGAVFQLYPNGNGPWGYTILTKFHTYTKGWLKPSNPYAGVIFDAAGNLYGTTSDCIVGCSGTVFQLTPGGVLTVLHAFRLNGTEGHHPHAGLIFDAAGSLYGTTHDGGLGTACGTSGCGAVFKLTPKADGSWTETLLHSFNSKDGASPYSGLIFDQAGNLYGTTSQGGDLRYCGGQGCGVVFKLTPNSKGRWEETVLHFFTDHPGANPYAGLIFDTAGNLYGTTAGDGSTTFGSVFEITP